MKKIECLNCMNLVTREISKKTIKKGEDLSNPLWKFYQFPINVSVMKRLETDGICQICYCKMNMMARDVYVEHVGSKYHPAENICVRFNSCE